MEIKLNMCILLGSSFNTNMHIPPDIGIPLYLSKFNHQVTYILSSDKVSKKKYDTTDNVRRLIVPMRFNSSFIHIFKDFCNRARIINEMFKSTHFNVIFVRRDAIDGIFALYLRYKYKIPLVFEIENPIEQTWQTKKRYTKHKYITYIFSKLREFVTIYLIKKSDLIIPISDSLKEYLENKGIDRNSMTTLQEGVLLSRFGNFEDNLITQKYDLDNYQVIIYVGTMDKLRNLDVLISAFYLIKNSNRNTKLLMVGDGTGRKSLQELTSSLGLEKDVIFTGYIDFNDVPNFIAAADIGMSPVPPLSFYKVSSPIKMLEYMAMGVPVIANEEIIEHREIISKNGGGILVKYDAESMAKGINYLLNHQEEAKKLGLQGREWVTKNRSYEVLAKDLEYNLKKIVST